MMIALIAYSFSFAFSIQSQHAVIEESEDAVTIKPSSENAVITVNGEPVQDCVKLTNGDR